MSTLTIRKEPGRNLQRLLSLTSSQVFTAPTAQLNFSSRSGWVSVWMCHCAGLYAFSFQRRFTCFCTCAPWILFSALLCLYEIIIPDDPQSLLWLLLPPPPQDPWSYIWSRALCIHFLFHKAISQVLYTPTGHIQRLPALLPQILNHLHVVFSLKMS